MNPMIVMGLVQGGLSILGATEKNAAIEEAATQQYNANKLFVERDESVQQNQLQDAAKNVNRELGAALSSLVIQARSATSKQVAATAEKNVYGNSAFRQQAMVAMKEALATDNLAQKAESKIVDVQTQMKQVKYQTEARHAQNKQSYNNQMSQKQSSLEIMANGLSAGMSGYSSGQSIQSGNLKLASQQQQLGLLTP